MAKTDSGYAISLGPRAWSQLADVPSSLFRIIHLAIGELAVAAARESSGENRKETLRKDVGGFVVQYELDHVTRRLTVQQVSQET